VVARVVPAEDLAKLSAAADPFLNINPPEEYGRLSR